MRITAANAGLVGIAVCAAASLAVSVAFIIATLPGEYDWIARAGGAAWVWLLSMIVFMPLLIPFFRQRGGAPAPGGSTPHH